MNSKQHWKRLWRAARMRATLSSPLGRKALSLLAVRRLVTAQQAYSETINSCPR